MENLSTARRHVRQMQDRVRQHKRKRWDGSDITWWCLETALCISCIMNYDFDLGVEWLMNNERRGAPVPADSTATELKSLLEDAFLKLPLDPLMSWVDPPTSSLPSTVIKTAMRYAQGHGLATWVREKNVRTGFVVRTERLIEHYNDMVSSGSTSVRVLPDVLPHTHATGRKWAQRWRRKHSGYVGSLSVREPVSTHEIRQKVRLLLFIAVVSTTPLPWSLFLQSFLAPQIVQNWAP
jgi:hypothetical protein